MLGAGLEGIERALDPDQVARQDLPSTIETSISAFAESTFTKALLGEECRNHYVAGRQNEVDSFRIWLDSHITDFEFQRYFRER